MNQLQLHVSSKTYYYISMMLPLNFPVSVLKQYNEVVRDYL